MPRSKNKRNSTVENNVVQKAKVETTIRDTNVPVELTASTAVKPLREKDNAIREEIKKVTAQQTIVKEEDLLERYTESPDLAFRSLQFQEIPIAKSKNGPKYLAAADPITVLKAKIWVEQFRLEMTNLNFKKAESCLRKSLDINPNCAETWTYHAEMLSAAGRAPEALKEYMIATAIDPTYSRAYFKAAMLYESTNNIENAYDFYSRAIDVDSSFSKAYLSRAALSVKQEDRKSAIEDYTALIAVDKKNAIAYKERGKLRMIERNYAGAVEDFTSYLEIDDPSAEIFYRRGIAKVYTGKIIDGCNDFNTAVQLKYPDAQKAIKKYCE
jgi:tetratricopeptide (TPR) repeat protein